MRNGTINVNGITIREVLFEGEDEGKIRRNFERLIEELVVPARFEFNNLEMGDYCEGIVTVGILGFNIKIKAFVNYSTFGIVAMAYIVLPRDHPLRKNIVRQALYEFYQKFVEEVEISAIEEIDKVTIFRVKYRNVEETPVEMTCRDVMDKPVNRKCMAYLPLEPLKQVLQKYLSNAEKIMKIIEETKKIIEEVEEEFRKVSNVEDEVEVEVDQETLEKLKRKLEENYIFW